MGFFNRNQKREQPVELECAIIERSPVEVGELEQMVRVTFEEKQELALLHRGRVRDRRRRHDPER